MNKKLQAVVANTLDRIPGVARVDQQPAHIVQDGRKMAVYYGRISYCCSYDTDKFQIFFTLTASQKLDEPKGKIQVDLEPHTLINLNDAKELKFWQAVLGYTSATDKTAQKATDGFIQFDLLNDLVNITGNGAQIIANYGAVDELDEHTFRDEDEEPSYYDGMLPNKYYGLPLNITGQQIGAYLDHFKHMDFLHQEVAAESDHDVEDLGEIDFNYVDDDNEPAFDLVKHNFESKDMPEKVMNLLNKVMAATNKLNELDPEKRKFNFSSANQYALLLKIWQNFIDPKKPQAIHNYMVVDCKFPNIMTFSMDTDGKVFLTAQLDSPVKKGTIGNTWHEQFMLGCDIDLVDFAKCCRYEIDYRYNNRGIAMSALRDRFNTVDNLA